MLISYEHHFIFVHVYRTGGVSMNAALQPYALRYPKLSSANIVRRIGSAISGCRYKDVVGHLTAAELRQHIPERVWQSFFKFAVVRNPWSWQVSMYHYVLEHPEHFQHEQFKQFTSFDHYIEWRVNEDCHQQKSFLVDEEGKQIVDYVARLECIESDFAEICGNIGLSVALPHANASGHRDYRDYFNDRTRKLIEEAYHADIALFGYTFAPSS